MADEQPDQVSVPTLVMTGGPLDGTAYPLQFTGREVVVGSSLDADVQILLGNVESFHARIGFEAGALVIADADSATGTFVNGERIEAAHPLSDGDRICLGPPGAKGSAKLILKLPGGSATKLPLGAADETPGLADEDAAPAFDNSSLLLSSDDGLPPSFNLPSEAELSAHEPLLDDDDSLEGMPRDDAAGGSLDETEDEQALFVSSAPALDEPPELAASEPPPFLHGAEEPALGDDDVIEAKPVEPEPMAFAPQPPSAPPPAPARVVEPPPPPPRAPGQRLTAPPPPPPAPASPHAAAAPRPEYQSELPSIPIAGAEEPLAKEFPRLHPPARPAARAAARPAAKRGRPRGGGPSLPMPLIAGILVLAVLAGLAWKLWPRAKAPELASVNPARAETGQTITLTGKYFGKQPEANTVLFGALPGTVSAATPTSLTVVVPAGVKEKLPVTVETKGGRSAPVEVEVIPTATAKGLEPDVAMPGQSVLIRGEGFSKDGTTVQFAGLAAASIENVPEGLRVVVPQLALPEGSTTNVVVQSGSKPARSFPFILGRLPLVIQATPNRGAIGQRIVLNGRGFDPKARGNSVTIGGQRALVVAASETALSITAPAPPAGDMSPDLPIAVTALGRTSATGTPYAYVRASGSGFAPRFFAAPVLEFPADDLAFVSTELGPVLVLGGPGGATSTAERAATLADQLNAAVEAAKTRRASFELREQPQPGVALAGDAKPLLLATAADVAAYSRAWSGARGAQRPTPLTLARHWTALLSDYVGLFVYRERPLALLTLNPASRVFSEIYAEARRRSPEGTSVPTSLVEPLPPSMAEALRQAALGVSGGSGRAAVAIEGTWQGTIEDPDRGSRGFRAVIRSEAGRLSGTLTTGQGGLELTSQLREIGFERGGVRFIAALDGAPHRFQGTLEGNRISGTIERPNREPARFTMEYSD